MNNAQEHPRMVALVGPLNGQMFSLTGKEFSIGRDPSNQLPINDISLSRRHCLIKRDEKGYTFTDLRSHNQSFINGMMVMEQLLEHGDRIGVGDSVFLFLLHADATPTLETINLDEGRLITRSMVQLRREDARYLQPERVLTSLPSSRETANAVSTLLKIGTAVNSIRKLKDLERQLLTMTCEAIPAERGAILLVRDSHDDIQDFASVFSWDKFSNSEQSFKVSETIISPVIREGVAVLSTDVFASEEFGGAESLLASQVRSLLAVPLLLFERVLGVIYLDTTNSGVRFNEEHLQLLTAIAGVTAAALENARYTEWLENENSRLRDEWALDHDMVGSSPPMNKIYGFVAKVAPTDSTVLINGESGTGKELVARAIYLNSSRAAKPYVAINCAALTETLLESEFFGHEKGAFTGAVAQKPGKFEKADGGTVFLDEVGELAPSLQAKLLRVLQEREFERVGGTRTIKVDIRIIAATNRNLLEEIKRSNFRQDLYYRLNVISVEMPPLRERREDIPRLADYFVAKYSQRCKRHVKGVSANARDCLLRYDWTGNVRELENAIERAVVLGTSDLILPEDLPEAVLEAAAPIGDGDSVGTGSKRVRLAKYHEAINELKRELIVRAVEQARGNYTEAAKLLGVHPNYLHRLVTNMDLRTALKK